MVTSATPFASILRKRIILVAGKGGVGRTSVTAAIARVAASRGKRVLVLEIADAGNDYSALAKLFGRHRLPDSIEEVEPGIRAGLLLPKVGQEQFLGSVLHSDAMARTLLATEGLRRFAEATPSFRELGIFFHFLSLLKAANFTGDPEYELIIVDLPATGHALALTGLPQIILNLIPVGHVARAIREGQSYLNNQDQTATVVVTLPESLPVTEALELIDGLRKTKMPIGGVVLNRMPNDPFQETERAILEPLLDEVLHLGATEFRLFAECLNAERRLAASLDVPLFVLPDSDEPELLIDTLIARLRAVA